MSPLQCPYSITTVPPTALSFSSTASASSFFNPFLMTQGALSTSSFASFSPRSVTPRISLISLIFDDASKPSSLMSKSVFSSAAGAAASAPPPPPAAGAEPNPFIMASVIPSLSLRISMRSCASSMERLRTSSAILNTFSLPTVRTCGLSKSATSGSTSSGVAANPLVAPCWAAAVPRRSNTPATGVSTLLLTPWSLAATLAALYTAPAACLSIFHVCGIKPLLPKCRSSSGG
mmetsp:Transcript_245/g.520  ORF Transcript_245/g.520 Transcript_245/m.520 type:complete len:233 (+) Transcript_245:163-861(+)